MRLYLLTARRATLAACLVVASGTFVSVAADDVVLVSRGSTWRYLPGIEEASSPDTSAWRRLEFDDSAWPQGPAPFAFRDGPIGTDMASLDPPMEDNYTGVFLRQTFEVPRTDGLVDYRLEVNYDDGFLVWINGVEVLRENMRLEDGEEPTVASRAARGRESGEFEPFVLPDVSSYVVEGTNQLAVQAFNVSDSSRDFHIDVELVDPFGPDIVAPRVEYTIPAPGSVVRRLDLIEVVFTEPVDGVDAGDLTLSGSPAVSVQEAPDGRAYLFAFEEPAPGPIDMAWTADAGIRDRAEEPNAFQGDGWAYVLDPDAPPPAVRITEFVAANRSGLLDEDREESDWIEVTNLGTFPVSLVGWSLTDDPSDAARWIFPSVTLEPGASRIVFASGKDRRDPGGELHTNFGLASEGEFLALYGPQLPREPTTILDPYPPQKRDVSYGTGEGEEFGYYLEPTPGEPNDPSFLLESIVPEPVFSRRHGFHDEPFELRLSSPMRQARILYTTDGSDPTGPRGQEYQGPLTIEGTSDRPAAIIRAVGVREGHVDSDVIARTYVFPEAVLLQSNVPAGFPRRWGSAPGVDYEVDPQLLGDTTTADRFREGLVDIPTVSLVADVNDIFGTRGIYSNPQGGGFAWERPCSAELIYPDRREGFQINCGVRILGGASRRPDRSPKHSFRLLFKGIYGPTQLRFPLYDERTATDEFDTLVLRANYNNSWIHWDSGQRRRGMMIRDQWCKDTQLAMGHPSGHAIYTNLYVNGLYWGVFILVERPSAPFAASYFGGEKEEYDALNSAQPVDGTGLTWSQLLQRVRAAGNTLQGFHNVGEMLDYENFADYMLMNFYGGNHDWPSHNWYAARRRIEGGLWRFFSWDAERTLEGPSDSRITVSDGNSPGEIHTRLRANPEYRVLFGDRAHRHLFNGGALTPGPAEARFQERIADTEKAVWGESVRWGDYRRDVHRSSNGPYELYQVPTHWAPERSRLERTYFPNRTRVLIAQLQSVGLYPRVEAPVYSQHGGFVEPGFVVEVRLPEGQEGEIWVTTDGSDPRVRGTGDVSETAFLYSEPIVIDARTTLRSRTLEGAVWSALNEATFRFETSFDQLVLSEVMYNPSGGSGFEFVELHNGAPFTIDLEGVAFTNGIDFTFPAGAVLPPGERAVVVADRNAFASRYPDVEIAGVYGGRLSNGGEKVTLKDASGVTIFSVDYDDEEFWTLAPDGYGFSLVLADPAGRPDSPQSWIPSAAPGGSPGAADPVRAHGRVLIHEVFAPEGAAGWIELANPGDKPVDVSGWYVSDRRDDTTALRRSRIPDGVTIGAGELVAIDVADLESPGAPFELAPGPGAVFISSADPDGNLTGVIEGAIYGAVPQGGSVGVVATSSGLDFVLLNRPTRGGANAGPRPAEVVINEIHYHPVDDEVEFVELYNPSASDVDLHDDAAGLGWFLEGLVAVSGAGAYEFPPEARIPARGYLLLVGGDPVVFRELNEVPPDVPVIGPYRGALDNGGEGVTLLAPAQTPIGLAARRVDRVVYNDKAPWPIEADGLGVSLERRSPSLFGNEALHWGASEVAGGTPGRENSIADESDVGGQTPGDITQDGRANISDVIQLLGHLFRGRPSALPCGDTIETAGNRALLDANGDAQVDASDAVSMIRFLFLSGPAHPLGVGCVRIPGCPEVCQ